MTMKKSTSVKRTKQQKERIIISPSLLSSDFSCLASEVRRLRQAGCRWVHFDVMDGHFVPNLTFGAPIVAAVRPVSKALFFDVHLMIDDPMYYAPHFIKAGADLITFHLEVVDNADKLIRLLHRNNVMAGIALKPKTGIDVVEPWLSRIDVVMIMSVEPGFGGQKLIPSTLNKMRELRLLKEKHKHKFLIEIDGGIYDETAPLAVAAGADVLVAGSFIFGDRKISQNVQRLRAAAESAFTGDIHFKKTQ